jgi:hypothetical protein
MKGIPVNVKYYFSDFATYWDCASIFTSSNSSACAENVALGVQCTRQTSHPFPVSHASKKASATSVIDVVFGIMTVSSFSE